MKYAMLIPFLPLAAFLINILFGRFLLKDRAHIVAIAGVFASFVLSVAVFIQVAGGAT